MLTRRFILHCILFSVQRKRNKSLVALLWHFKDTVALYFVAACPHTLYCAYMVVCVFVVVLFEESLHFLKNKFLFSIPLEGKSVIT